MAPQKRKQQLKNNDNRLPCDVHGRQIAKLFHNSDLVFNSLKVLHEKIDSVLGIEVNGYPRHEGECGLSATLRGMHNELLSTRADIVGLKDLTEPERAARNARTAVAYWAKQSRLIQLLSATAKNKVGKFALIAVIMLAVSSVAKAVGIELDLQSLLKLILGAG